MASNTPAPEDPYGLPHPYAAPGTPAPHGPQYASPRPAPAPYPQQAPYGPRLGGGEPIGPGPYARARDHGPGGFGGPGQVPARPRDFGGYADTARPGPLGHPVHPGDPRNPAAMGSPPGPSGPSGPSTAPLPVVDGGDGPPADAGTGAEAEDEWNPTEDSLAPLRGRHRIAKQRGGSMGRGGAVLGVGMIAAVGAGGVATADSKDPTAISLPDFAHSAANSAADSVQDVPGVSRLVSGVTGGSDDSAHPAAYGHQDGGGHGTGGGTALETSPFTHGGLSGGDGKTDGGDAGEALRARILAQAQQQQSAAEKAARNSAAEKAVREAKAEAEHRAEHARKEAAEAERKAEAEKQRKEEAARRAKLARGYTLPVGSYHLTAGFGQAGNMWQNDHTGQDFAAPTGTPVKAVHGGTIKQAGWAGSYGYRTVLEMDDGTQLWFCHQSSITKSVGDTVRTGEVIGRVGATGNVTGSHLHLEVRPHGGDPINPMPWLHQHGLTP